MIQEKIMSVQEIAARFDDLAQKEMWFEIQEELFADDAKSIEPKDSPYFKNAEGKKTIRQKGDDWVSKVEKVNALSTTHPVIGGNHFAVGRTVDIEVRDHGRVVIDEIMLYKVQNGKIVVEQFFY